MLLSVLLAASGARAEGVGLAGKDRSNGNRLYGVFTLMPTATGLISIGGPALRRLTPGARRWEPLHTVPGDNLYRVAADDAGRLLAAWSKENLIHLILPDAKQRLSFPKPTPAVDVQNVDLSDLVFAANGREAFVVMNGNVRVKTARYSGPSRSSASTGCRSTVRAPRRCFSASTTPSACTSHLSAPSSPCRTWGRSATATNAASPPSWLTTSPLRA